MIKHPEDISKLNERIEEFKRLNENGKPKALTNTGIFAKGFLLGTEFLGAVLVGFGFGFLLDRIFGTKCVFIIVMMLLGCVSGVLNMYRTAQKWDSAVGTEETNHTAKKIKSKEITK